MTYVTSRGFELPASSVEMNQSPWFSLWMRRLWPYHELRPGDDLYWYESPSQTIVWKTRVESVEAFEYSHLSDALDRLDDHFGGRLDRRQPYLDGKPHTGFCLGYVVRDAQRVLLPKPTGLQFNRSGWERGDRNEIAAWLAS